MFVKGITANPSLWRRAVRQWRGLRARLGRDRAALTLGLLLALGVGEPLLCIAHCDLWLPFMFSSAQATPHQHMHHNHAGMATSQGSAAEASATVQPPSAPGGTSLCALHAAGDRSAPFHVPPSPVHELIIGIALVLLALPLVGRQPAAPPNPPPPIFPRPPLRPPILAAA